MSSDTAQILNSQQLLERLSREGSPATAEPAVVNSPGARAAAWTVKVKSNSAFNLYNIVVVVVGGIGVEPEEIGGQMQAYNLAESFTQQGTLAAGTYAVMSRVGYSNVFYAKP